MKNNIQIQNKTKQSKINQCKNKQELKGKNDKKENM